MKLDLTAAQAALQARARAFADEQVAPLADQIDRDELLPPSLVQAMGKEGFLGALVSPELGGAALDMIAFGLLNEELGRACSSARSLLTVHAMVCAAIARWGTGAQKRRWLPPLAGGSAIGAFALTEPEAGSDAASIQAQARRDGSGYLVDGRKQWITAGQLAEVYLLFARLDDRPAAFLVPRRSEGLEVRPVRGMLGTRGSMLAELELKACRLDAESLIGAPGFGISAVATSALDVGRYSVAWGSVGICQACLDASRAHARSRVQFGKALSEHQLIRQMLTDMITRTHAARLLCVRAGQLKDRGDPDTLVETFIAKYFASTAAMQCASDAVQIQGARGASGGAAVARYFRDAKVMEIIEGSSQIQQLSIAGALLNR